MTEELRQLFAHECIEKPAYPTRGEALRKLYFCVNGKNLFYIYQSTGRLIRMRNRNDSVPGIMFEQDGFIEIDT